MKNLLTVILALTAAQLSAQIPEEEISPQLEAQSSAFLADGELHTLAIIGYESMYVTSGAQGAYESVQPNVEFEYYGAYAGVWANLPIHTQNSNPNGPFLDEYNLYFGYGHGFFDDLVTPSIGATYYYYPQQGSSPNHTWELNLAVEFDVFLTPTIEYNYDFNLEQNEVVFSIGYDFDLSEWTVEGLSLETAAAVGYLHANDTNSNQVPLKEADGYAYFEAVADLVYSVNDVFSVYVGPRLATNNNGAAGNLADRETNIWWGAGLSLEF